MRDYTPLLEQLKRVLPQENVLQNEPMRKHTTFRAGGNADLFLMIEDATALRDTLAALKATETPYFLVGNGSNLLVSDDGYRGAILYLSGDRFKRIRVDTDRLTIVAGAGATLNDVARKACDTGLDGLVFASGIPGTIGGALYMNAGAFGGEMKDVVTKATAIDPTTLELPEIELSNEACRFGYRTSVAKERSLCFLEVELQMSKGDPYDIALRMRELSARRRDKQPLEYPSAGSAFKRPEGQFAGKLIMDAGLSGYQVGGAQIAKKHCGFVVNTGEATATEVYRLMKDVEKRVYETSGVRLEPEVIFLGEFPEA